MGGLSGYEISIPTPLSLASDHTGSDPVMQLTLACVARHHEPISSLSRQQERLALALGNGDAVTTALLCCIERCICLDEQ